jgi:predicted ArsR family transcriptional regulator
MTTTRRSTRIQPSGAAPVTPPGARQQTRDLVQRQARALGDPTRYEIFRYVARSPEPVRVAALTEHFGFNHTAIRQHLAKLTEALLLVEELAAPVAGRPPLQYRVAPTAMDHWGVPGPYELLAMLLLEVADGTRTPIEAGVDAGRRLADKYAPGADPLDVLEAEMASRGFEPRRDTNGDVTELVLDRCPFEAAASASPGIVCDVHRGLADGILDGMDADERVRTLIAYDPRRAGCRLQLEPRPPHAGTDDDA